MVGRAIPKGREWSGGLPAGPEEDERPSWKAESGRKGHPKGPGMVGMPSRKARSGQEALTAGREDLQKCQEWSGGLAGVPTVVGRPSH